MSCITAELPAQGSTTPTAAAWHHSHFALQSSQPKFSVKTAEWLRLGSYGNTGAVPDTLRTSFWGFIWVMMHT